MQRKTWQTCDERDNKNLENPKLGKNLANKNGELNQIEWQWKRLQQRLPATWTSMPCTFTTTQRQRWNPLDRIIVTGASRTL